MAKYIYETVTGAIEVEVDERWVDLLKEEDSYEQNADRCHSRGDHKYAPGTPVSLYSLQCDGKEILCQRGCNKLTELSIDLFYALNTLSKLQKQYYVMFHIFGYKYAEIARLEGKHKTTISEIIKAAEEKIKKFFD
jgi:DNA-directed RNA polymerase specialized sigma24 family protein